VAQALRQEVETNDNAEAGTNIVVQVSANPGLVLLDRERFNQFYEAIKDETDKLVPDLTTEWGRKEIASLAFKVTKTKTAIDAAGKLLKEEAQATVTKVDAARREIRLAAEKAEADRRAADVAHRGKIMGAAKQAIMGHGVGEATAKAIVLAIAAGEVPAVTIQF